MLKQRLISSVLMGPLFIALILLAPTYWLKLVFAIVLAIGGYEWAKLSGVNSSLNATVYAVLVILLIWLGDYFAMYVHLSGWLYWLAALWWVLVSLWILYSRKKESLIRPKGSIKLLLGLVVLLPSWFAITQLHATKESGPQLALFIVMVIWFADIGAYVAGRWLGSVKLAPAISPGKTVEGVIGGLLVVLLFAVTASMYFNLDLEQILIFVLVTLVVSLISVFGDLFESVMKRQAGVKDSGSIMPGHGGVLDRIDSIVAAAPLFMIGSGFFIR